MKQIEKLQQLIAKSQFEAAIELLDTLIAHEETEKELAELYFERGKINWKIGKRSQATADYLKASSLDPDSPAQEALNMAREIEAFFNPDLFNP